MPVLQPKADYYLFTLRSTEGVELPLVVGHRDLAATDGTELGGGWTPGPEMLAQIGEAIAGAVTAANAPYWGTFSVISVEANPTAMVPVELPPA